MADFCGVQSEVCKFTFQRKKERFWNSEEVPSHGTEVFRVSMGKDMGCSKGMPMDMRGTFQKGNLFIKNCVFILTCLNFSHLQNTLHLMQCTYWDMFYIAQISFWIHWFWSLLVLPPFFVSPIPHGQNVSLWGLVSYRETNKKSHSGATSGE